MPPAGDGPDRAEAASRPNVLVVMCDQMKATASHLYGSTFCETPSLERLARTGVTFEHAYAPHPLCTPSRVSMWTARYPHTHGARRNETPMPDGADHAFRLWSEAGFHTGLIGKNHCFAHPDDLARFDTWCELGHEGTTGRERHRGLPWPIPEADIDAAHAVRRAMPRQTPTVSYAVSDAPIEAYGSALVAAQALRFLEAHGEEPFALWVSFPDPHTPYEAPRRYAEMVPPERVSLPPWGEEADPRAPERQHVLERIVGVRDAPEQHLRALVATYHAQVRFVDDGLGRILDALDRLGLAERTIVVFCSDHGDFAGEHGMTRKGGMFFDCLTRVPLVVAWPGRLPEGHVEPGLVSLIDVVPTLLRLQGIEAPAGMQGRPLPGVTDAAPRHAVFSEYGAGGPRFTLDDLARLRVTGFEAGQASLLAREAEGRRKMVRTARWKYVTDPMGDADELYDLENDPWELENLAGDRAHADVVTVHRRELLDWSIATEDARPVPLP
jgi:arylsulfatase A-like enzyme